jgi:uncharacterized protein YjdB
MKKFVFFFIIFCFAGLTKAQTDLIISEYVEGWSTNKALEIFNPTDAAIDLSGYRITRYSNGSDIPPPETQWYITLPSFELQPYRSYVVVLDKRDPDGEGQDAPVWEQLQQRADVFLCPIYNVSKAMYFNGNDAVALEKTDGTLVDLFARWGAPAPASAALPGGKSAEAWTDTYPHFTGVGLAITADHTLIRNSDITTGVTANPSVFDPLAEYDTLPANTFEYLGWHEYDLNTDNETPAFPIYSYEFIVAEQAPASTAVGNPVAIDPEEEPLYYYINYGNFVYINDNRLIPFEMDKEEGDISVSDPDALIIAERDSFYLKITAHDGYSQTPEVTVLVRVTNETQVPVTGISVTAVGGNTTINTPNGTLQLTATVTPTNATVKSIYWLVENGTGEATVNSEGLVTAVADGTATIKAISKDGSGIFGEILITISGQTSDIHSQNNPSLLKIFPNPVTGSFLSVQSQIAMKEIRLANITGKILRKISLFGSSNEVSLSVEDLNPGIYFLQVTMEDQTRIFQKLLIR